MKISASPKADPNDEAMLAVLQEAALEAGRVIMKHYANGCAVQSKKDSSPVTEADRDAEAIILAALASVVPDIPVVAEEEVAAGRLPSHLGRRFLLVDPLDGTREFLLRNGDFTVNIGLIEDGAPVLGIVYAPVRNRLFIGNSNGAEDTAAGDAVLRAAGGLTTTFEGTPLSYGQRANEGVAGFANPNFVAFGGGTKPVFAML